MWILTSVSFAVAMVLPHGSGHLHHRPAKAHRGQEMMADLWEAVVVNAGLEGDAQRVPLPEVVLTFTGEHETAGNTGYRLSSADLPPHWTPVPHGPIQLEVRLPEGMMWEFLEVRMDGEPLEPRALGEGLYELSCPAPGKHLVQARYLWNNQWSRYSPPLRFEIRLPERPRIVALSDTGHALLPVERTGLAKIRSRSATVRLANLDASTRVVAYLDGQPVPTSPTGDVCCRTIPLEGHVTPGVHTLTVRTVHGPETCSLTSKPSNEVMLHYYDEDVYLLLPRRHCENRLECLPAAEAIPMENIQPPPRSLDVPPPPQPSGPAPVLQGPHTSSSAPTAVPSLSKAKDDSASRLRPPSAHPSAAVAVRLVSWNPSPNAGRSEGFGTAEGVTSQATATKPYYEPFYFASPAHFPLRDFGLQGEALDREGLVIYEDMKFSIEPHTGRYRVEFRSSYPEMPVTLRLQFKIQPRSGGPWYTVTLPPIRIAPEGQEDRHRGHGLASSDRRVESECCDGVHKCVCTGRSEILARCFNEMNGDARIRRQGTARFGYGYLGHER